MKRGFTLSEILVTLGIIGVISAITVPAVMSNFQKKTYEVGIKKAYNTVNTAIGTYMAAEDIDDLSNAKFIVSDKDKQKEELEKFAKRYFKVVKTCTDYGACFSDKIYSLDRSENETMSKLAETRCTLSVVLADGISMCFKAPSSKPAAAADGTVPTVLSIDVDTNGNSTPNTAGRDLFTMVVDCDGVVKSSGAAVSNTSALPMDISAVMDNGWKMDY